MSKLRIATRFGQAPNTLLHDPRYSLKAKGLYVYIQSKPDGWDFSANRIMNEVKDGRDGVLAGLQELEEGGYLERIQTKDSQGQWEHEYILHLTPILKESENPVSEKPTPEKPTCNKERNIKKEVYIPVSKETDTSTFEDYLLELGYEQGSGDVTEDNTVPDVWGTTDDITQRFKALRQSEVDRLRKEFNKKIGKVVRKSPEDDFKRVVYAFRNVNPTYEMLYKRRGEREALEVLLGIMDINTILEWVEILQDTNNQQGFPKITTISQLSLNFAWLNQKYNE